MHLPAGDAKADLAGRERDFLGPAANLCGSFRTGTSCARAVTNGRQERKTWGDEAKRARRRWPALCRLRMLPETGLRLYWPGTLRRVDATQPPRHPAVREENKLRRELHSPLFRLMVECRSLGSPQPPCCLQIQRLAASCSQSSKSSWSPRLRVPHRSDPVAVVRLTVEHPGFASTADPRGRNTQRGYRRRRALPCECSDPASFVAAGLRQHQGEATRPRRRLLRGKNVLCRRLASTWPRPPREMQPTSASARNNTPGRREAAPQAERTGRTGRAGAVKQPSSTRPRARCSSLPTRRGRPSPSGRRAR